MKNFLRTLVSIWINIYFKIFFKKNIIGVYNLSKVPISFNFIDFCFFLEFKRKIKNKKKVLLFILDKNLKILELNNFNSINKQSVTNPEKYFISNRDRFFNMMTSSLFYFDKFSFSITSSNFLQFLKDDNNIFCYNNIGNSDYEKTLDYIYDYPNYINKNPIKISNIASKFLDNWLNKNKINKNRIITLHLRNQIIEKKFNTPKNEWYEFYKYLKKKNFFPIIVDDLDNIYIKQKKTEILQCDLASYNLDIRLALSEISKLNIIMQRGAASSLIYLNCNYLIINPKIHHPSFHQIKKISYVCIIKNS